MPRLRVFKEINCADPTHLAIFLPMARGKSPSQAEFKAEIENWLINFVEKPSVALKGWAPCPYARKARVKNQIGYLFVEPQDFESSVEKQIQKFSDQYEVFVIGTFPDNHTHSQVAAFSKKLRDVYWSRDIWTLFDHPTDIEEINGLKMNHGVYLLCMIQRLSKLAQASEQLESEGYYDTWPAAEKRAMIEERKKKSQQLAEPKESITL